MSQEYSDSTQKFQEPVHSIEMPEDNNADDTEIVITDAEDPSPQQDNSPDQYQQSYPEEDSVDHEDVPNQRQHRPKRKTPSQRISEITYQKKIVEAENFQIRQALERERQERELERIELTRIANEKAQESFFERESKIKTQIAAVEIALEKAKNEDDVESETKAQSLLAKYGADLSLIEHQKRSSAAMPYQQQQNYYQPVQQPYYPTVPPQPEPVYNPDFEEWAERNTWYGSDSKLTNEANAIADELAGIYAYNNMKHMIGSQPFLEAIDSQMASRYGVSEQPQRAPQHRNNQPQYNYQERTAPVAPINRQGGYPTYPQQSNQQNGRNQVELTRLQHELLSKMNLNYYGRPQTMAQKAKFTGEGQRNVMSGKSPLGNNYVRNNRI